MACNAKQKGAQGEREFSSYIRGLFSIPARRGQQYSGSPDSPDVVTPLKMHFEVKRRQSLNLHETMDKLVKEAHMTHVPVIAHRKDHTEWLLTIRAKDMERFSREFMDFVATRGADRAVDN